MSYDSVILADSPALYAHTSTSTTVLDLSGNSYNGTFAGTAGVDYDQGISYRLTTEFKNGFTVNPVGTSGNGAVVYGTAPISWPTGDFTFSWWSRELNISGSTEYQALFEYAPDHIWIGSRFQDLQIFIGGVGHRFEGLYFRDGTTQHWAVRWTQSSGLCEVFRNGVLVGSATINATYVIPGNLEFVIGQDTNGASASGPYFPGFGGGTLWGLAVFSSALADARIQAQYNEVDILVPDAYVIDLGGAEPGTITHTAIQTPGEFPPTQQFNFDIIASEGVLAVNPLVGVRYTDSNGVVRNDIIYGPEGFSPDYTGTRVDDTITKTIAFGNLRPTTGYWPAAPTFQLLTTSDLGGRQYDTFSYTLPANDDTSQKPTIVHTSSSPIDQTDPVVFVVTNLYPTGGDTEVVQLLGPNGENIVICEGGIASNGYSCSRVTVGDQSTVSITPPTEGWPYLSMSIKVTATNVAGETVDTEPYTVNVTSGSNLYPPFMNPFEEN